MLGQSRLLACALILLASQVEAGCLKNLFCHDKTNFPDKSYVRVANELYEATSSSELKDNVAAASKLHENMRPEKESRNYDDLLKAIRWLKDEPQCDESGMKSLRLLAEAMAANGNLRPEKMTEPLKRLNRIVLKQIVRAANVCFESLASEWPNPWHDKEEFKFGYKNLHALDSLSRSMLLDSQQDLGSKEFKEFKNLYLACSLVQGGNQVEWILKPYLDLLMAAHIANPESNKLAKFYEDPDEQILFMPIHHPNQEILDNAYRLRACDLLSVKIEKSRIK